VSTQRRKQRRIGGQAISQKAFFFFTAAVAGDPPGEIKIARSRSSRPGASAPRASLRCARRPEQNHGFITRTSRRGGEYLGRRLIRCPRSRSFDSMFETIPAASITVSHLTTNSILHAERRRGAWRTQEQQQVGIKLKPEYSRRQPHLSQEGGEEGLARLHGPHQL